MSKSTFPVDEAPRVDRMVKPFRAFMKAESAGGIVLLACTAVALVWANSGLSGAYHDLWHTNLTVGFGAFSISEDLHHWVNDGLMAIFFFVVGLEIKRELLVGELSSARQAALPIAGAIGGMLGPALLYVGLNLGTTEINGWAVPMATDIAFALGIMALLGPRVPLALKVFLAAAAIVDDLGAVLVIALFYTDEINTDALMVGGAMLTLLILANLIGVRRTGVYVFLGLILWAAVLKSGIHATIAGVLLAMTIPARFRIDAGKFIKRTERGVEAIRSSLGDESPTAMDDRQTAVHHIEKSCREAETPLIRLEHALVPWQAFLIMPVFALANAGIDLSSFPKVFTSRYGLAIAAGLVIGKTVGITLLAWLVTKLGIGELSKGVTWGQIVGVAMLAGIGFTMALFIAGLAFEGETLEIAKSGIMLGSAIAGVAGFFVLRATTKPPTA
ncbi:MAG: Na+/H+ antiporter NhaA [Planctomycetota bacterium]|jgi:NhaA family Na+:H+ antiporter